jgi:hypothetical protein
VWLLKDLYTVSETETAPGEERELGGKKKKDLHIHRVIFKYLFKTCLNFVEGKLEKPTFRYPHSTQEGPSLPSDRDNFTSSWTRLP